MKSQTTWRWASLLVVLAMLLSTIPAMALAQTPPPPDNAPAEAPPVVEEEVEQDFERLPAPTTMPHPDTIYLWEDFEGTFPPTGWTVYDNAGEGAVWDRNDAFGAPNRCAYGDGYSAAADGNALPGYNWDTELWSPPLDLTGETAATLEYASNFQDYAGNGEIWLDISTDGGGTWTNIRYQSTDDPSGGTYEVEDLTPYVGNTILLRWRYAATSSTAWYWHIDNVLVKGPSPDLDPSYKSAPGMVETGSPVTYTIVLSNGGNAPAYNTVMTDVIPAGTTYISGSLSCDRGTCWYDAVDDAVYWTGSLSVTAAMPETPMPEEIPSSPVELPAPLAAPSTVDDAAVYSPPAVDAVVLLDQPPSGTTGGYYDDAACDACGGPQIFAEDFVLTETAEVEQIILWGGYYPGGVSMPTRYFTVVFHTDAGGLPGAVVYYESNVAYTVAPGGPEYEHVLTLANPVPLTPGTYWVEVFFDSGWGTDDFAWNDGVPDPVYGLPNVAYAFEAPGASWAAFGHTFAIQLLGAEETPSMAHITFAVDTAGAECGATITNTAVITDPAIAAPVEVNAYTDLSGPVYMTWDLEADDGGFIPSSISEWEWGTPDPAYADGPAMAHSGVNVWGTDLDNDAADDIGVHVLTKTMTLPNDPNGVFLGWWDWYGDEASDERQIWVDGTLVWDDSGGTDQPFWALQSVDLSAWAGQTVDVLFVLEVCCGNPGPPGWYIDDISIYGGCATTDLVMAKHAPQKWEAGMPLTYTLVVANLGTIPSVGTVLTDPIPAGTTYVPGSLSCSGGTCWEDGTAVYWTGDLDYQVPVFISFMVDPTAAGCGASIVNTAVLTDTSMESPLVETVETELVGPIYAYWPFELDDGGFTNSGTITDTWEWGVPAPAASAPPGAHSGMRLWATNLLGDIPVEPSQHWLTRTVTLPTADPVRGLWLQWWDWWDEDGVDVGTVYVDGVEVYSIDVDQLAWESHTIDLMPWEGQTVELAFHYDAGGSGDGGAGWFVDDVAIHAGCIPPTMIVDAPPLETALCPDETDMIPFTICNLGESELVWELSEMTRTLQVATVTPSPQPTPPVEQPVVTSEADCAAFEPYVGAEPPGYAEYCMQDFQPAEMDGPAPFAPTDTGYALEMYSTDNVVTFALNDFPGQTVVGPQAAAIYAMDFDASASTLYAINNDAQTLGTLSLTDGSFTTIGACIPEAGHTWTGLAIDPLTNDAYASSTDGTTAALYTVDLATGAATLIGTNTSVPFLIDITMNTNGEMYGHDISTDSIYSIDYMTFGATLIGPTGYDGNYAQGMDFDNDDGTLYIFLYQGGGNNVYGIVDTLTGAVTPLSVNNPTGEFEGATQTAGGPAVDVPWLSEVPTNGVILPGTCVTVEVTFDAAGMMPGEYHAALEISSNDPVEPSVNLPVTMTVGGASILTVTTVITELTVAFTPVVEGDVLGYLWDFGDGMTSTMESPIHTYDAEGCYSVTLTVDTPCDPAYWMGEVCVTAPCEPVDGADFVWSPLEPVVEETVTFTGSVAAGEAPITYTWDFGDGETGMGQIVTHAFTPTGDYTVWMTATNCGGAGVSVISYTVTVTEMEPCDPVTGTSFTYEPMTPVVSDVVTFTASASGTMPIDFAWDFGDGMTGTGQMVTHVYVTTGTFTVTLTATNACGEEMVEDVLTVTEPGPEMNYIYLPVIIRN